MENKRNNYVLASVIFLKNQEPKNTI